MIRTNNAVWMNVAFIIWLISEIMFSYSVVSRIALVLFVGVTLLVIHKIYWNYALTGYALFALWSVLNILTGHAVDRTLAVEMTQTIILNLVFLCAFVSYCRYTGDVMQVLQIYKWVIFAFCIPCFLGGLSAVFSGRRLTILGINENTIAMLAAYAVVLFVHDILNDKSAKRRYRNVGIVVFLLLTILLTGSRKGLIIPLVGVYILICFRKSGKFVINSVVIAAVAIVALYLLLNVPVLYRVIGYRIAPVLQYLQGEDFTEASLDSRLGYIQLGWEESKNSPIWGHGLDCFRTMRYAYRTYSHCNYIEILYALGWIGLMLYYAPYLRALFSAPDAMRNDREKTVLILAMFIPYIICDYFMVSYFTRTSLIIPLMAMLALRKTGTKNEIKTFS